MRRGMWIWVWALAGCPSDDTGGDTEGATTGGPAGTSTTTAGADGSSTGVGTSAEGSTGAGLVWPPDDGVLTCTQQCEGPWDCCPAGAMDQCPGAYPYNFACIAGYCVPASCESDAECGEGRSCTLVDDVPVCVTPCTTDPECASAGAEWTCRATADDGTSYCMEHCEDAQIFCGNTSCDPASGRCVCQEGQCLAGWSCV